MAIPPITRTSLPRELLLDVIDNVAGSSLSFPEPANVKTLVALCSASRFLQRHVSRRLYSAISIHSPEDIDLLTQRGVPHGSSVRALSISRQQMTEEQASAAVRLLSMLASSLERLVIDGRYTQANAPLDSQIALMPKLRDIVYTQQGTELLDRETPCLPPCPSVGRLAVHDFWTKENNLLAMVAAFPNIEDLVLAADVSIQLVRDVLERCSQLKRVLIIRPQRRANDDWHAPPRPGACMRAPWAIEADRARGIESPQEREAREKREVIVDFERRGVKVSEVLAPEEGGSGMPNWEAECLRAGDCWSIEGTSWA